MDVLMPEGMIVGVTLYFLLGDDALFYALVVVDAVSHAYLHI